jgi:hypothetical protein
VQRVEHVEKKKFHAAGWTMEELDGYEKKR